MKNDIIMAFRLYANTAKNKPETTIVVVEPIALIDMLKYLELVGDVVIDAMEAINDVFLLILTSLSLLAVLKYDCLD